MLSASFSRLEGIIPAIESAHAVAAAREVAPSLSQELGRRPVLIVNISGRGDKDVDTAARWFGLHGADDATHGENTDPATAAEESGELSDNARADHSTDKEA